VHSAQCDDELAETKLAAERLHLKSDPAEADGVQAELVRQERDLFAVSLTLGRPCAHVDRPVGGARYEAFGDDAAEDAEQDRAEGVLIGGIGGVPIDADRAGERFVVRAGWSIRANRRGTSCRSIPARWLASW